METTNDKNPNNDTIEDEDKHQKVEKLLAQIMELESEKQESLKQFGAQRGKMKELFLQKEEEHVKLREEVNKLRTELDEARTQVTMRGLDLESKETERLKSQEELRSLQQLLSETLEEESRYQEEIRNLKSKNDELEAEVSNLKNSSHQSHHSTTGVLGGATDSVLGNPGTMFTSLARKVVSLGVSDTGQHSQQLVENLEESMRKAKAETDVLRELVVPFEEEISALKKKLRETDEELQRYRNQPKLSSDRLNSSNPIHASQSDTNLKDSSERDPSQKSMTCDMCLNYEAKLVQAQTKLAEVERQSLNNSSALEKCKEELAKEIIFRKQMEEKWTESKEMHKNQVTDLQSKLEDGEKVVNELQRSFKECRDEVKAKLLKLVAERKMTEDRLKRIQKENEELVGKHLATSQSLQNDDINLPDNVEKLQEMWLAQREQLINAKVGLERSEEERRTLECIYNAAQEEQERIATQLANYEKQLVKMRAVFHLEKSSNQTAMEEKQTLIQEIEGLRIQLQTLKGEKKKLETSEGELRNRLISLQTGLENGEAVQKDFVMLSQSLQKELERLRGQNNVLRWEHEEDVSECRGCEQPFKSGSKGKFNCRHCGRIFCLTCLSHKVTSGPSQRESRVCHVCHTLLNSETAPYFSTEPPHQTK